MSFLSGQTNNRIFFSKNLKGFQTDDSGATNLQSLIDEGLNDLIDGRITLTATQFDTTSISGSTIDSSSITTSAINATAIGTRTPSTGAFTSLASSGDVTMAGTGTTTNNGNLTWDSVRSAITIPGAATIGTTLTLGSSQLASTSDLALTAADSLNLSGTNINFTGGLNLPILSSLTVDNVMLDGSTISAINNQNLNINIPIGKFLLVDRGVQITGSAGSAINNTAIGLTTASSGRFTNVEVRSGLLNFTGQVSGANCIKIPTSVTQSFKITDGLTDFMDINTSTNSITINGSVTFTTPLGFTSIDTDVLRGGADLILQSTNNDVFLQTTGAAGGSLTIRTQGTGSGNRITMSSRSLIANMSNGIDLNPSQTLSLGLSALTGINVGSAASGPISIASSSAINVSGTSVQSSSLINTTEHYEVDGIQVVTNQQGAITDLTVAAVGTAAVGADPVDVDARFDDVETKVNAILATMRVHGLIAT